MYNEKNLTVCIHFYIQGAWPLWNADLEPAWWFYHPRRRRGEQRFILCGEVYVRALYSTWRSSTWPLHHIHPEEILCRDGVLHHSQRDLSGSVQGARYISSYVRGKFTASLFSLMHLPLGSCRGVMTWWRGSHISVSACQRFAAALHRRPVTAPSSLPTHGTALRRALLPNGATTPSAVSRKAPG